MAPVAPASSSRLVAVMSLLTVVVFVLLAGEPLRHVYTIYSRREDSSEVCESLQLFRHNATLSQVPRKVHMMWKDNVLPPEYASHYKTCRRLNPGWEFTMWTDAMIDELLDNHYSWLLPTVDNYSYRISKFDAVRLIILDKYGGVYVDIDANCTLPFNSLVSVMDPSQDTILGATDPVGFTNFFIVSKLNNPFIKLALNQLELWNRKYLTPHWTIMRSAGPCFLHTMYTLYPCKGRIYTLTAMGIKRFLDHKQSKSWHHWDGKLMVVMDRYQRWFILVGVLYVCTLVLLATGFVFDCTRCLGGRRLQVRLTSKSRSLCCYDMFKTTAPPNSNRLPTQQYASSLRVLS